jgi:hypothetical protein
MVKEPSPNVQPVLYGLSAIPSNSSHYVGATYDKGLRVTLSLRGRDTDIE